MTQTFIAICQKLYPVSRKIMIQHKPQISLKKDHERGQEVPLDMANP